MAEGKKSFIVYTDSQSLVNKLPDETAGQLFKMLFAYTNDENPETNDPLLDIAFEHFKQKLKKDLQKWEQIKKKRSAAGKASAEKRKQKATKPTSVKCVEQNSTNPTVSVNVNVNDNVNEINNIYNRFVDEVKKGEHKQATEQWYMRFGIKNGTLTPLLKEFKGQLIIDNTKHPNTLELRKHFNNWLNKQEQIGKLTQYKN